jgi:hypothetical protein
VAVIGYGGLFAVYWRTPTDARAARATSPPQAESAQIMARLAVPVAGVARTLATDVEPRTTSTPTARTLNALWQGRDTRSLDRAFATLRRETLAFRSCGMRMTDADRAVARCQGSAATLAADGAPSSRSPVWTIDFQRTGGRWQIARVSMR